LILIEVKEKLTDVGSCSAILKAPKILCLEYYVMLKRMSVRRDRKLFKTSGSKQLVIANLFQIQTDLSEAFVPSFQETWTFGQITRLLD
jgi:hypothetical protein